MQRNGSMGAHLHRVLFRPHDRAQQRIARADHHAQRDQRQNRQELVRVLVQPHEPACNRRRDRQCLVLPLGASAPRVLCGATHSSVVHPS